MYKLSEASLPLIRERNNIEMDNFDQISTYLKPVTSAVHKALFNIAVQKYCTWMVTTDVNIRKALYDDLHYAKTCLWACAYSED